MTSAIGDDGRTITFDTKGEDEASGHSIDDVACVLLGLDLPDSMVGRIEATRALDGMQTGEWDDYTATWTYHPTNGMTMIVTTD